MGKEDRGGRRNGGGRGEGEGKGRGRNEGEEEEVLEGRALEAEGGGSLFLSVFSITFPFLFHLRRKRGRRGG